MLLALATPVIGAAPAQAAQEQLTSNGVTLTWNPQDFLMTPSFRCHRVPMQLIGPDGIQQTDVHV